LEAAIEHGGYRVYSAMYSSAAPVFDDVDEVRIVSAQEVDAAAAQEAARRGDQLQAPSFVASSTLERLKSLKSKRDAFSAEIGVARAKAEAKTKKRTLKKRTQLHFSNLHYFE
jgi:hypothetical protein